jgi:hypothetical protein
MFFPEDCLSVSTRVQALQWPNPEWKRATFVTRIDSRLTITKRNLQSFSILPSIWLLP